MFICVQTYLKMASSTSGSTERGALEQALIFDAGSSGTRPLAPPFFAFSVPLDDQGIHIFNMRMPPGGAHVPRPLDEYASLSVTV